MNTAEVIHSIDLFIAVINRIGIPALLMLTAAMFFSSDDEERLKEYKGYYYRLVAGLVLNNALAFFVRYLLANRK